ncbi:MAG: acetyl-CoA C-acyltransferase [Alphaproteobacteria bacterium]|nr:acetyl-CoA C-acyltransferase [Alphaproteobacteria bacterium]
MNSSRPRAVVVDGVRTPFVRSFGAFLDLDAIELGKLAVAALLDQTGLDRTLVDAVVWGGVVLPAGAPNVGREIALDLKLPPSAEAYTVTRACASGLQAVTNAVAAVERGEADVIIAGGADSTSNAAITLPPTFVRKVGPVAMSGKSSVQDYFRLLFELDPVRDLIPSKPAIAERSTGELMGESCERMAERNAISREAQDAFAAASHHKAAAAIASGRFDREVAAVTVGRGTRIYRDELVRPDTSVEKLAKLRPAFRRGGTLTAGNSSALTDGAAAVLIMREDVARALGFTPKAAFRSWAYVGVDPADQLLMGPAIAMPKALERAGMQLGDASLVDIHEAFAAQVLSVLKMLGSKAFAEQRLGRSAAVGEVDPGRLNVHGGSVSLGHPFGATGARMVTTMANELALGKAETAVLGICAAGGLGAAAVMEAV